MIAARLVGAAAALVAAYVLFAYAADELGGVLGELFAEAVIPPDNARKD